MLSDFTRKTGELIRNNYKYFVIPLGFLFLVWIIFIILNSRERPVTFEPNISAVIYSEEETDKTMKDLAEKGYTNNIGPYYEDVRAHLLARQLGIMKYRLKANNNLWTLAKHYNINIDTIVGANPYLKSLVKLKLNQEIILISSKGVLHKIKEKEDVRSIALLYNVPENKLTENNEIKEPAIEGDYLFVPATEPLDMTEEMKAQYALTKLFGSPIFTGARKYTSPMRIRSDPFT
ncbi:MAG: LysM peptidoglycan-binding domain-containing protein, partial [Candidatus Firestonebacteria bacterium]